MYHIIVPIYCSSWCSVLTRFLPRPGPPPSPPGNPPTYQNPGRMADNLFHA